MNAQTFGTVAKWAGIFSLCCGAFYNAVTLRDYQKAMELATLAVTASGFAVKLTRIGQQQQSIKADTTDIRNNPTMPGTPTGPGCP